MSDTHNQPVPTGASQPQQPQALTADEIFVGGGELGALCRVKDWSATALGPVEHWPASLKTLTNLVLNSTFPMIILWGQELIQIYNDEYRLIMGAKHPTGLGQPSRECWPEVTHVVEPLYQRVLAGETISMEEGGFQLAPNGYLEDFYLTFCYTPIRDETSRSVGIFVTIFNVTSEVRTRIERDHALNEAQVQRQRLYEVFQQTPSFFATLHGPDHTFELANPLYLQLVSHRDILGKPVREALPEVVEQGFIRLLDKVYTTGEAFIGTEMLVQLQPDINGPSLDRFLNFVYQPMHDAAGTISGILVHGVDVTDQVVARQAIERSARELAQVTRALAQSNRDLDQFAYVASHDLKAPLRGIANLASWIEEDLGEAVNADVQHHLELLRGRVHRMDALIEGVLNYSRAGRHVKPPEQIDTGALVRDVVELQALPDDVQVEVQASMPTVEGERIPLQQIFMNLIGNAVKYTRLSRPDVVIQIGWQAAGDSYVFSIRDNGPGIDSQFQDRIWGIFQTLEARDKVEGTGIGLAIVKKVVESVGGQAWVESTLGEGATFLFSWPMAGGRRP